jgi:pyruvate,orthophosphate dikinase
MVSGALNCQRRRGPPSGAEGQETAIMTKFVYDFAEGDRDQKDLLGGKGANLAEMTNLGLPVPPGFTITTEACRAYLAHGRQPDGMGDEVTEHLTALEKTMGKQLGQSDDPLLVSVRSGAKFSMPGMMETVLNVGLNDSSVHGLAAQAGDERFAWDSYRRLVQMFGATVLGIEGEHFAEALDAAKRAKGTKNDLDLDAADLATLVETFKGVVREHADRDFPQDPREQMDLAVRAVFDSWNSARAAIYRRQERIPADLGTAVSVCSMVFGNLGMDSGTGVAFTRDPASGARGVYGDYLQNAQGEDVVAGIRNTLALTELERIDKESYDELMSIMATLEHHYRDLCDIEFTIERGKLWMLQTRVGKRTAAAAFTVAIQLVDEGLIDMDEALLRVTGAQLANLMFPRFDRDAEKELLTTGMNASPGAATGTAVFDSPSAVARAKAGEKVILVRRETTPDDLDGMIAAQGVLTSRGGRTSHAAVVARGMGKTAVCGAEELEVDVRAKKLTLPDGREVVEGDMLSIDGTNGEVYLGEVPVVASPVMAYFEGSTGLAENDDLVAAVDRIMRHADGARRLRVRVNADTGEDCATARTFGAEGVGLCRTEHMFLGERRELVENLVLAETRDEREKSLAALLPHQIEDFTAIFRAMEGLPVTIRLLDPPLHEFLPDLTELSVQVALARERGELTEVQEDLLTAVRRLHEQNPMLGLRGVRLGIAVEGLYAMQVRAITRAAAALAAEGIHVEPEIMVPLVGTVQELQAVAAEIAEVVAEPESQVDGSPVQHQIGTMIELPRAALVAAQIAEIAQFFSFGTNDLTQTTWGFSRDDVESSFFSDYLESGIFGVSPFESLDVEGVGELVEIASWRGREVRPDLKLGICGEHGGDPDSVHFFHRAGLNYVSCSPFRIPVARLEAGRAPLM